MSNSLYLWKKKKKIIVIKSSLIRTIKNNSTPKCLKQQQQQKKNVWRGFFWREWLWKLSIWAQTSVFFLSFFFVLISKTGNEYTNNGLQNSSASDEWTGFFWNSLDYRWFVFFSFTQVMLKDFFLWFSQFLLFKGGNSDIFL